MFKKAIGEDVLASSFVIAIPFTISIYAYMKANGTDLRDCNLITFGNALVWSKQK
jgi:hypothetical protein